jgi:Sel1 repeat
MLNPESSIGAARRVIRGAYWLDEPGRRVIMQGNSRNMDSRRCEECGASVSGEVFECPGCGAALPATGSASPAPGSSNLGKKALRLIAIACLTALAGTAVIVWLRSQESSTPPPAVVKVVDVAAVKAKAEAGDAEAQKTLGECYSNGQGVTQSYAQAAQWYRKAADQGNAAAQAALGELYEVGQGVQRDATEAAKYYRRAAEKGHARGEYSLAQLYLTGNGVQQDLAEALKWYRQAAEQGYALAQYNLGMRYKEGKGVAQDPVEAYKWFTLAAARGVQGATEVREALQQDMTRDQIKEGQSRAAAFAPRKPAPPAQ